MTITSSQWTDYINKLSTLNGRGSKLVQDWIDKPELFIPIGTMRLKAA